MKWLYLIIDLFGWWCSEYVLNFLHPDHTLPWYAFVFVVFFFYLFECYDRAHFTRKLKHVLKLLLAVLLAGMFLSFTSFWAPFIGVSRLQLFGVIFLFALFAVTWRALVGHLLGKEPVVPLVLIGCSKDERFLEYLDDDERFHVFQKIDDYNAIDFNDVVVNPCIVCDFSEYESSETARFNFEKRLVDLRMSGIKVYDVQGFYQRFWDKVAIYNLSHAWFLFSPGFTLALHPYYRRLKRVFDIIVASVGLILASPFFLIVPILIRMESEGTVMFRQERVGLNAKCFDVLKFRSMCVDAEKDGAQWAQTNDPRVTGVGCWLRKLRIDELPQLINVLRGEMSLIGPRPERPVFVEQLEKEIPFYQMRHLVKPGVTGWAQVNHPYGSSVDDAVKKLEYDLFYVKNYSLLLDVRILLRTVRVVLFGKGQ